MLFQNRNQVKVTMGNIDFLNLSAELSPSLSAPVFPLRP